MAKVVYTVRDEGDLIVKILKENGFEVLVGDGTCDWDKLARCDALVPGKLRITAEVLDGAPNVKVVSKFGVGMDKIDIPECTKRGIIVCNTRLSNYVSVAEHALTLMLMSAKKIYQISQYLRHEYPDWNAARRYQAVEVCGKTLAVIGCGNIGRRMAMLSKGLEMRVIGYDPYMKPEQFPDYIEPCATLEEALHQADFVSVHVAGTEETRGLIGKAELAMMNPSAILINTTRGFVVDEKALIEALRDKTIAGAGLDVFTDEPLLPGNPLMFMENVVATPHNAANTYDARLRSERDCAQNIIEVFSGKHPATAFNGPF